VFLNVWSVKLPWVECVVDAKWKVHDVRCKFCTKIKRQKKVVGPKIGQPLETWWEEESLNHYPKSLWCWWVHE
jgi:hypothetical protein